MSAWELIAVIVATTVCVALLMIVWAATRQAARKAPNALHMTSDEQVRRVSPAQWRDADIRPKGKHD